MLLESPNRLSLANLPTPLQPLDRLTAELGGPRIWLKRDDLTGTALSGNKVRKLEFVCAEAESTKADVLMTTGGVQSNHCRTTAIVAAQLGLKCHLILRGDRPSAFDGNTLLAELSGAELSFYSNKEYMNQSVSLVDYWKNYYQEKGLKVHWIPTGASDEIGLWGYYSAVSELHNDFKRLNLDVGAVCCATGSGGTHAGLSLGFHHLTPDYQPVMVQAYAVCDDAETFQKKSISDIEAWYKRYHPKRTIDQPDILVNDQFIGAGYAIANDAVYETIRLLARLEGVILDPVYTGKAFQGLISDVKSGYYDHCENIVFIHTGGVFGLFPFRGEF